MNSVSKLLFLKPFTRARASKQEKNHGESDKYYIHFFFGLSIFLSLLFYIIITKWEKRKRKKKNN
jgi:hypothetical protein